MLDTKYGLNQMEKCLSYTEGKRSPHSKMLVSLGVWSQGLSEELWFSFRLLIAASGTALNYQASNSLISPINPRPNLLFIMLI
jgi:hypothetical protein